MYTRIQIQLTTHLLFKSQKWGTATNLHQKRTATNRYAAKLNENLVFAFSLWNIDNFDRVLVGVDESQWNTAAIRTGNVHVELLLYLAFDSIDTEVVFNAWREWQLISTFQTLKFKIQTKTFDVLL